MLPIFFVDKYKQVFFFRTGYLAILEYLTSIATAEYCSINETVYPCKYKYYPVCGSDGVTYFNQCLLESTSEDNQCRGLAPVVATEGYCEECKCQNINLPVCTLDGITYPNECELDCVQRYRLRRGIPIIYLAYRARCNGPSCDCPTIASPVCGTDNILYRNDCVLKCASQNSIALGWPEIGLKNVGACRDGCSCPLTYQPVCGSDGRSYDNPCKLQCENDELKDKRTIQIEPLHSGRCDEYDPLCASDGTTFDNQFEFDCENMKRYNAQLPALSVLGKGECVTCICEAKDDPVCGTNNQTYANDCILKCESEALEQKGFQGLAVLYKGECQDATSECHCNHCPMTYEPVCGDDNLTYWNYCWMTCVSICNHRKGLKTVQLVKRESCVQ